SLAPRVRQVPSSGLEQNFLAPHVVNQCLVLASDRSGSREVRLRLIEPSRVPASNRGGSEDVVGPEWIPKALRQLNGPGELVQNTTGRIEHPLVHAAVNSHHLKNPSDVLRSSSRWRLVSPQEAIKVAGYFRYELTGTHLSFEVPNAYRKSH